MKNLFTNLLLFITAIILLVVVWPIGFLYGIFTRFSFNLSAFFKSLAIGIDQLWNVFVQYLFDDIMITKNWYKFGDEDETISHCLWINKLHWTLKPMGKLLCCLLDKIDKNHCEKSI